MAADLVLGKYRDLSTPPARVKREVSTEKQYKSMKIGKGKFCVDIQILRISKRCVPIAKLLLNLNSSAGESIDLGMM